MTSPTMTDTWPDYEIKILTDARIIENETGKVVWEPAADVAVIRIRTKLEAIIPVPEKLVGIHADLNRLRPYVIDELRRKIDPEPRPNMTEETEPATEDQPDLEPAPEPDEEPSDPHTAPLDDDDDARHLDPVDPRRREAEQRRGRSFDDDDKENQ